MEDGRGEFCDGDVFYILTAETLPPHQNLMESHGFEKPEVHLSLAGFNS